MLTQESLEKIFEVLEKIKSFHASGDQLEKARHKATKEVARKSGITYQTIEDGYRRRLGLRNIHEFQIMVEEWIRGDSKSLRSTLEMNTDRTNHMRIHKFFENDRNIVPKKESPKNRSILIYLQDDTYNKMMTLSKQSKQASSDWLSDKIQHIINDEYLIYWENEIRKLPEEQKKRLLQALDNSFSSKQ
jgi:hypothetical protein